MGYSPLSTLALYGPLDPTIAIFVLVFEWNMDLQKSGMHSMFFGDKKILVAKPTFLSLIDARSAIASRTVNDRYGAFVHWTLDTY
jgi:hypothetical protein